MHVLDTKDVGALALPTGFLSSQLALLLDVDGDAVFGKWGSEVFVFDYTADLGSNGTKCFSLSILDLIRHDASRGGSPMLTSRPRLAVSHCRGEPGFSRAADTSFEVG